MTTRIKIGSAEQARLEAAGIYMPGAQQFLANDSATGAQDPLLANVNLAMDAVPTLITSGNAGIPAFLTTFIDPELVRILTAKNQAAMIAGEVRKGSWTDVTATFPVVEQTGEVSSYGDQSNNGRAGVNTNFPQRENYLFQVVPTWGELELDRAGLAKIGWANEVKNAAVSVLEKFRNLTYFYGVANLQSYGLLNDPGLSATLTPATKAAGTARWITSGGAINATANEVFADVQAIIIQVIKQSAGVIDAKTPMVLAMSPTTSQAMYITNSFGLSAMDMLSKNYPNVRVETAVQYGALSAANPQGSAAGEIVQLIAEKVDGQQSAYCAFSEKLRTHPIIRGLSDYKQKLTAGTWGAIVRFPMAFASMTGV